MNGKKIKTLKAILQNTRADRVLASYLLFVLVDAALIWVFEPSITTYQGALWYCYAVISTAGFGDIVVTRLIPRILSIVLTAYSLLVIAIVTGVVVNYYTQMIELKNRETLAAFLDQLERLPEMSEEELQDMSERVAHFRKNIQMEPRDSGHKNNPS